MCERLRDVNVPFSGRRESEQQCVKADVSDRYASREHNPQQRRPQIVPQPTHFVPSPYPPQFPHLQQPPQPHYQVSQDYHDRPLMSPETAVYFGGVAECSVPNVPILQHRQSIGAGASSRPKHSPRRPLPATAGSSERPARTLPRPLRPGASRNRDGPETVL